MPSGNHDHEKDKTKDKGPSKDRDGGTRDRVGTGNGAHSPRGNQAGKNADGQGHGGVSGTSANGGKQHYSDARDDPVAKENRKINEDADNLGESWFDGVGGFFNEIGHGLLGMVGLDEENETFSETAMRSSEQGLADPNTPTNESAHYSFDPIQALAGFAGLATGMPTGIAYGVGKYGYENLTGQKVPWEKDLGTSVLGGNKTPASAPSGGGTGTASTGAANPDRRGADGNGLLGGQAAVPQTQNQQPATPTTPTTPSPGTPTTPAASPSKFPTPTQKFQGPSYWAGDWVYNPATKAVEWKQKANGLLPQGAAA